MLTMARNRGGSAGQTTRLLLTATALLMTMSVTEGAIALHTTADQAMGRQVVAVAPNFSQGSIVVSLKDRRLYFVHRSGEAISYPVATPRDEDVWTGAQVITAKRKAPSWRPTPQMRKVNPRLPDFVPGGHPFNPMGSHALYLGNTYYRIHGTDAPWLVGRNVSKGCIRLHNEHISELFHNAAIGTKVVITTNSIASQL